MAVSPLCFQISTAHAQRGEGFAQRVSPPPSVTTGFPGIFDTNVVAKGHVVADLPTTGVNFGFTGDLTLGVYALSALPFLAGEPSLLVRARYRLFGDGTVTSILDLQTGYVAVSDKENRVGVLPAWFLWNTSKRLGARHELALNVMALYLRISDEVRGKAGSAQVASAALAGVGLTYQFTVVRWLQLRATLLSIPLTLVSADSAGASVQVGELDDLNFRTAIARALASFRLGKWLLEGGGYVGTGVPISPWISVSKDW
ncbi:MAG: hypothetical protein SF187_08805 [Deltaproteobacteria bacterium]|nr:hypothetical protein [Deltaproteobacteria bacterium]